jgi:hypothetical protein
MPSISTTPHLMPVPTQMPANESLRPLLNRQVFRTSRLLEFCSKKELVLQTGHPIEQ